jgi:hypothetical protein
MTHTTQLDLIAAGFRPDPCKAGVWVNIETGQRVWIAIRRAA